MRQDALKTLHRHCQFALLCLLSVSVHANTAPTDAAVLAQWSNSQRAFIIGDATVKVQADLRCGFYNNQALYASFGLEAQPFQCAKIVVPISIEYHRLLTQLEWAPLYSSIQHVNSDNITYDTDKQGHAINGNNPYNDWYKNLGRQVYAVGDIPLLQAYVGLQASPHQRIIAGRLRQQTGLADRDTPWNDDGTFSPYAYWLSRDLLSGVRYQYQGDRLDFSAAVLSGNNPMKGYANYLNQVQSANLKANNTPSYGATLRFHLDHYLPGNSTSTLSLSGLQNTQSSTWVDELHDGKRRNSVYAAALLINWPFNKRLSLDVFGQCTRYLSGLSTDSVQSKSKNPLMRNIQQDGYFVGATLHYRALSLSYTFERFDRFDFNTWAHWIDKPSDFHRSLQQLLRLKQSSHIINLQYQLNRFASLNMDYERINNPLQWLSDISNNHPDYRFGTTLNVSF